MARRLSKEQWLEIKTRYEFGDPIRAIARDFLIADTSIREKIKKNDWTRSSCTQTVELKKKIAETSQSILQQTSQEQMPYVEQRIEQEITDTVQIMKQITNLHKGALNIHNIILKKTYQQAQSGEMSPREASQILANAGVKIDQIHKTFVPTQPTTAIQINNANAVTGTDQATLRERIKNELKLIEEYSDEH